MAAIFLVGGCTRFDLLNATVPSGDYTLHPAIPYGSQPRQTLDVCIPLAPRRAPDVVVFFYGGDWQDGSKEGYRFVAEALTSRGFIAIMPDYRLYPQVTFPAFVQDGAMAVKWAHDHASDYGGDPSCVFLMGHSAGAHIAAMLTLNGKYLQAVGLDRSAIKGTVGLSGPYDFVPPPDDRAAFNMSRTDTHPDPNIEPIHFVDGKEPPMLLVTGLKDTTVDPGNTFRLAARIADAGGRVKVITYPGCGHVGVVLSLAWSFQFLEPTLNDVTAYFHSLDGSKHR